jgi:hypothetical protein
MEGAMTESRFGKWLPLLFAVMTAVDGWLALGLLAQSTVMAAELIKRLRGKGRIAVAEANDLV